MASGSIVITYGNAANIRAIAGRRLVLLPGVTNEGEVVWACATLRCPRVSILGTDRTAVTCRQISAVAACRTRQIRGIADLNAWRPGPILAPMRMDKLTSRFQSALADAQSLAVGRDHQFMEPAHVLGALLDQQDGSTAPVAGQGRRQRGQAAQGPRRGRSTSCRRCRARPAMSMCRRT